MVTYMNRIIRSELREAATGVTGLAYGVRQTLAAIGTVTATAAANYLPYALSLRSPETIATYTEIAAAGMGLLIMALQEIRRGRKTEQLAAQLIHENVQNIGLAVDRMVLMKDTQRRLGSKSDVTVVNSKIGGVVTSN